GGGGAGLGGGAGAALGGGGAALGGGGGGAAAGFGSALGGGGGGGGAALGGAAGADAAAFFGAGGSSKSRNTSSPFLGPCSSGITSPVTMLRLARLFRWLFSRSLASNSVSSFSICCFCSGVLADACAACAIVV